MEVKARLWNVNMSPKYSREVAVAIKGLPVVKAKKLLEGVAAKETLVVLYRYNKEVPHHKGKPGRYPVKVAKHFIKLLDNALANAKYLGADEARLRVDSVEVYRGRHKRPFGSRPLGKVKIRGRRASVLMILKEEEK
jgi:large subunit ribosomal protein L22